jgi:orotidine-5'-phosphate decarboxylase
VHFADLLLEGVARTSPLVLGIDPSFALFPPELLPEEPTPTPEAAARALDAFCEKVIEAAAGLVPAVKLQSAYFEQAGTAGMGALARAIGTAREAGMLVILDAKRGDIGATSEAYARAFLDGGIALPGGGFVPSDLAADALTVNPFLGDDAVAPFLTAVKRTGKGLFFLVKTSNPGSKMIMDVEGGGGEGGEGGTVSERLADFVEEQNAGCLGESGYGLAGAVVGATFPAEAARLRARMPRTILLVPGVGTQGGTPETVKACFAADGRGAVVPISRALTYPEPAEIAAHGFVGAVRQRVARYARELRSAGARS